MRTRVEFARDVAIRTFRRFPWPIPADAIAEACRNGLIAYGAVDESELKRAAKEAAEHLRKGAHPSEK